MTTALDDLFVKVRAEKRAALIAYIPAGFPTIKYCHRIIQAFIDGGVDAIEIGFPYSDPVMDGPTIQAAAVTALTNGTTSQDVLDALKVASAHVPSVVMTYWNPIEKYGVEKFAAAIASHGGSGVIHPDITIEESDGWLMAASSSEINPIYVVAPSTSDERLKRVTSKAGGFVYAASIMGVTGARTSVSSGAEALVARTRAVTDLPIAVGLGVSTREQAKDVARYADGVIVGSAFVKAILDAPDLESGLAAVTSLARELSLGVRGQ
ncbi:MAG: tryptophan synthase subunit alpha [Candidatus Planktophila sp.]